MKSKSFDLGDHSAAGYNLDKTKEFVGLYKSAAETKKNAEKRKSDGSLSVETKIKQSGTPKRERSPNKNKKRGKTDQLEKSQDNIDGLSLICSPGRSNASTDKATSTPISNIRSQSRKVKSIMKNTSLPDQSIEDKSIVSSKSPKKRNKSVSFMLEDNEEVVIKRTKSEDLLKDSIKPEKDKHKLKEIKKMKKIKKIHSAEKENKVAENNMDTESNPILEKKPIAGKKTKKLLADTLATPASGDVENLVSEKKKMYIKKIKKAKPVSNPETAEGESNNNELKETKPKKFKKKKSTKSKLVETLNTDGEPVPKSQKTHDPDISEDLENLSIGDNAHTLSNMLDEMAVVDKAKKQQMKKMFNKNKKPKGPNKNETELEKSEDDGDEEIKEKEKWKKRRWNKDKKGDIDDESQNTTVIVENLPLSIMLNYRKLLTDHFVKYGLIKRIGIAEVYPTEESKPVFTTTITFYSDGAAQQALQEDNSSLCGARVRVRGALAAARTTLVLRSYADLSQHAALCSLFHGAGRIRSIRHLIKGKKSMSTAFIEFDGPEAVDRAIKMASSMRLGKKKIHLAKFEPREKTRQQGVSEVQQTKEQMNADGDSADNDDSEDSND